MIKRGTTTVKSAAGKTLKKTAVKASLKRAPLKEGAAIAVTLFGKLKETDPMYTAKAIDALFEKQQTAIDAQENKKKLALETIKTIATLGQNSSLRETISVVKSIGAMLEDLYTAMSKEEIAPESPTP